MGFKDTDTALLAGLFGQALYDVVYPKWWGGQGKASEVPITAKVNEQMYRPGSNCAGGIRGSSWQRTMGAEIDSTIPKGIRPKDKIDVTQMTPAGMHSSYKPRTGGPRKRGDPYNVDPENAFCGAGNAINLNIQNAKFVAPTLKKGTADYLNKSPNFYIFMNRDNCRSKIKDLVRDDYEEYNRKFKEKEGLSEDEERENSDGEINQDLGKSKVVSALNRGAGFEEDQNPSPDKKKKKVLVKKKITGLATDSEDPQSPDEDIGMGAGPSSPADKNRKGTRAANANRNRSPGKMQSPTETDHEPASTPEGIAAKEKENYFRAKGGNTVAGGLLQPVQERSQDNTQDQGSVHGLAGSRKGPGERSRDFENGGQAFRGDLGSKNGRLSQEGRHATPGGQKENARNDANPHSYTSPKYLENQGDSLDERPGGLFDTDGRNNLNKMTKLFESNRLEDTNSAPSHINRMNSKQGGKSDYRSGLAGPNDQLQGRASRQKSGPTDPNVMGNYNLQPRDDPYMDQESFRNNLEASGSVGMDSQGKTPKSQNQSGGRPQLGPKRSSKESENASEAARLDPSQGNKSGAGGAGSRETPQSKAGSQQSATPKLANVGKQSSASSKSGNRQSVPSPHFGGKQRSSSRGTLTLTRWRVFRGKSHQRESLC